MYRNLFIKEFVNFALSDKEEGRSVPEEKRPAIGSDPDNHKEFELDYKVETPFGELSVYCVQGGRDGQEAFREIINSQKERGWKKGPWWRSPRYWSSRYLTKVKRVAFLDGDMIAVCAGIEEEKEVDDWSDIRGNAFPSVPLGESAMRSLKGMSLSELSKIYRNIFDRISEWSSIKDKAICKQEKFYLEACYDPVTNQILWFPFIFEESQESILENADLYRWGEEAEFVWEDDGSSGMVKIGKYVDPSPLLYIREYYELTKDNKEIHKHYLRDGSIYTWYESDGKTKRYYAPDGRLTEESIEENNTYTYKEVRKWDGKIIYKKSVGDIYSRIAWDKKRDIESYESNDKNVQKIVLKDDFSDKTDWFPVDSIGVKWSDGEAFSISFGYPDLEIKKGRDGYWGLYHLGGSPKLKFTELPENLELFINNIYNEYGKFVPEKYGMEDFYFKK